MNCPVCGAEMHRVGLAKPVQGGILEEWACPACGFRTQQKRPVTPQRRIGR